MTNTEWTEKELEFQKEATSILKKASADIATLAIQKKMSVSGGVAAIVGVHARSLAINLAAACNTLGVNKEKSNRLKDIVLDAFHADWERLT